MKEAIVTIIILAIAKVNFIIWYYYTRNRVTHAYANPKHEWEINRNPENWTDKVVWPIFDVLSTTRKRRLILHGSFNDPETGNYMGAWYDTVNETFSLKMGKGYHHGYSKEDTIARIRFMFSDNTRLKQRWIVLLENLIEHDPTNFKDNRLTKHV